MPECCSPAFRRLRQALAGVGRLWQGFAGLWQLFGSGVSFSLSEAATPASTTRWGFHPSPPAAASKFHNCRVLAMAFGAGAISAVVCFVLSCCTTHTRPSQPSHRQSKGAKGEFLRRAAGFRGVAVACQACLVPKAGRTGLGRAFGAAAAAWRDERKPCRRWCRVKIDAVSLAHKERRAPRPPPFPQSSGIACPRPARLQQGTCIWHQDGQRTK